MISNGIYDGVIVLQFILLRMGNMNWIEEGLSQAVDLVDIEPVILKWFIVPSIYFDFCSLRFTNLWIRSIKWRCTVSSIWNLVRIHIPSLHDGWRVSLTICSRWLTQHRVIQNRNVMLNSTRSLGFMRLSNAISINGFIFPFLAFKISHYHYRCPDFAYSALIVDYQPINWNALLISTLSILRRWSMMASDWEVNELQ